MTSHYDKCSYKWEYFMLLLLLMLLVRFANYDIHEQMHKRILHIFIVIHERGLYSVPILICRYSSL